MSAAIIAAARGWLGTPYHHQAALRGVGCDCVGLVRGVLLDVAGTHVDVLPDYSPDWGDATGTEGLVAAADRWLVPIPVERARAGDVLGFRWRTGGIVKHCGILVSGDRMIHAVQGTGTVEVTLGTHWRARIGAAYRFPGIT